MPKTRSVGSQESKLLSTPEYIALAEFRYQLRRYLRQMEEHARASGNHPQQYQLLLAIKGLPPPRVPSVTFLAERMQMNHNSMVELADRCEKRGLIKRVRESDTDRRQVTLAITPEGEKVLRQQASASREELRNIGPILVSALQRLLRQHKALTNRKK
ncbi:MAG TPA: MarR family transcriptional regulator [Candidatus Angelobacter sp.]|jgi:DNA-binding MarR family transcriptional regulator|nr:MarR family transcriptional regulator [Candidatus Angelobacter sp.]